MFATVSCDWRAWCGWGGGGGGVVGWWISGGRSRLVNTCKCKDCYQLGDTHCQLRPYAAESSVSGSRTT